MLRESLGFFEITKVGCCFRVSLLWVPSPVRVTLVPRQRVVGMSILCGDTLQRWSTRIVLWRHLTVGGACPRWVGPAEMLNATDVMEQTQCLCVLLCKITRMDGRFAEENQRCHEDRNVLRLTKGSNCRKMPDNWH